MTSASIGVRILAFAVGVILARLLTPDVFGIYAIVSFLVTMLESLRDLGIGAALIRETEVSQEHLRSVFTFQLLVAIGLGATMFFLAPLLVTALQLSSSMEWLIRLLVVTLILSSFSSVPAILLERQIRFREIALVDIGGNLGFQFSALSFAWLGYGVWSFGFAAVIGGLIRTGAYYAQARWRPGLSFDWGRVRGLLRFGLPFQGAGYVALAGGAITPIVIGSYLGAAAVGYVGWAATLALLPSIFVSGISRVAFSAYSRIRGNREALRRAVEMSIRFGAIVMYPLLLLSMALIPYIVEFVYLPKWAPGIPLFYLLALSGLFSPILGPVFQLLYAEGKPGVTLRLTVLSTIIGWVVGVPLILIFQARNYSVGGEPAGLLGWPVASLFGIVVVAAAYWEARKIIDIRLGGMLMRIMLPAGVAAVVTRLASAWFVTDLFSLLAAGLMGLGLYAALLLLIERSALIRQIREIKNAAFGREAG